MAKRNQPYFIISHKGEILNFILIPGTRKISLMKPAALLNL